MSSYGFKIVAFLKRRKNSTSMQYAYVPHASEVDGKIYWPNSNVENLRRDAQSAPAENWHIYRGRLKKANIASLEEAELWEEEYLNAENTEAEETLTIPAQKISKGLSPGISDNVIFMGNNDNNEYQQIFDAINVNDTIESHPQSTSSENDKIQVLSDVFLVNSLSQPHAQLLQTQDEEEISRLRRENEALKSENKILNQTLLSFDSRLKTTSLIVEKIYEILIKNKNTNQNEIEDTSIQQDNNNLEYLFSFPINDAENLAKFNKELELNEKYRTFLIERYIKIGGTEDKENGDKVGRDLVAIFFTPQLMTNYSWTGISRTSGIKKKMTFQSFTGVLDLFFNIIKKADCRWSEGTNIKLFKEKILKHSRQINETFEKKKKQKLSENIEDPCSVPHEISRDIAENNVDYTEHQYASDIQIAEDTTETENING